MDTTRLDHLGCYGGDVKTPSLDEVASRGILFENFYSAINLTTPSHVTIFSSQYPNKHGVFENLKYDFPDSFRLLPEELQSAGYKTYGITSAYFMGSDWLPDLAASFDHFEAPQEGFWIGSQVALRWQNLVRSRKLHDDQEFFAWVHFYDPHMPYVPPQHFETMYPARLDQGEPIPDLETRAYHEWFAANGIRRTEKARALYKGEISFMDLQIGRVLRALYSAGLKRDTVILVMADHGELLGQHGEYFGHGKLHEGNIHVPFLMYWKGNDPARVDHPVSAVDIAPTVLDLATIESPKEFQGRSILPLLKRNKADTTPVFSFHQGNLGTAVMQLPFKLIWKREQYHGGGGVSLYDLSRDPQELRDLSQKDGANRQRLWNLVSGTDTPQLEPSKDLTEEEKDKMRALGYIQ